MKSASVKIYYNKYLVRVLYLIVVIGFAVLWVSLHRAETFDLVPPINPEEGYVLHSTELVPRESPDMLEAEDGRLYLFYVDHELLNVYTVEGTFLHGFQFRDTNSGISRLKVKDGRLCVENGSMGLYEFRDTELICLTGSSWSNPEYDAMEMKFAGDTVDRNEGYVYAYDQDKNRVTCTALGEPETILQFPERKYDPTSFSVLAVILFLLGRLLFEREGEKN